MSDVLHLYAQAFQHQEAWVVGTREGLTALRDALNEALSTEGPLAGAPLAYTTFTNDGEGYRTIVWPLSEEGMGKLRTPYVDPVAEVQPGQSPFMLMDREVYKVLAR